MEENFKQKDDIIKKIGKDYRKTEFLKLNTFSIYENLDEKRSYYNELKLKVDYILLQLEEELANLIFNEYLTTRKDNWWIYYYSKSTYYRLKNKAMNNFLEWWNV